MTGGVGVLNLFQWEKFEFWEAARSWQIKIRDRTEEKFEHHSRANGEINYGGLAAYWVGTGFNL
jgi:hypothetical protein